MPSFIDNQIRHIMNDITKLSESTYGKILIMIYIYVYRHIHICIYMYIYRHVNT